MCLTASLSQTTLPYILELHHTYQVWESLANRYNSLSKSHVQEIKGKLYTVTKTSTIEHYVDTIKEYAQKLVAAGSPVDEDDLIFHTLRGLPPVFNGFKTTVRAMRLRGEISFNEVVNMLNGEDIQLIQESSVDVASSSSSVLVATHGSQAGQGQTSTNASSVSTPLLPPMSVSGGSNQTVGQFGASQFGQFVPPQFGSSSYYGMPPFPSQSVLGPPPIPQTGVTSHSSIFHHSSFLHRSEVLTEAGDEALDHHVTYVVVVITSPTTVTISLPIHNSINNHPQCFTSILNPFHRHLNLFTKRLIPSKVHSGDHLIRPKIPNLG